MFHQEQTRSSNRDITSPARSYCGSCFAHVHSQNPQYPQHQFVSLCCLASSPPLCLSHPTYLYVCCAGWQQHCGQGLQALPGRAPAPGSSGTAELAVMAALATAQLQHLSLVSKITTGAAGPAAAPSRASRARRFTLSERHVRAELENHLHISEKTLAEFIIELSKGRRSSREFAEVRGSLLRRQGVLVSQGSACWPGAGSEGKRSRDALLASGDSVDHYPAAAGAP